MGSLKAVSEDGDIPSFKDKKKQFVLFYLKRFELFSKLGIFSMKWCEKSQRFIPDRRKLYSVINICFRFLVLYQMILIGSRTAWYLLVFQGTKKIDEFIILVSYNMVSSASGLCMFILWKKREATLETVNALIYNLSSLQGHNY